MLQIDGRGDHDCVWRYPPPYISPTPLSSCHHSYHPTITPITQPTPLSPRQHPCQPTITTYHPANTPVILRHPAAAPPGRSRAEGSHGLPDAHLLIGAGTPGPDGRVPRPES